MSTWNQWNTVTGATVVDEYSIIVMYVYSYVDRSI